MSQRVITGPMVLAGFTAAFAVIIGVNLYLAYSAVATFPGLEVPNSYVASQNFDRERQAQERLGWKVEAAYDGETLTLGFLDREGYPALIRELSTVVARPTHRRDDQTPVFEQANGRYAAPVTLEPGLWNLMIEARAADGTRFHQKIRLTVEG